MAAAEQVTRLGFSALLISAVLLLKMALQLEATS
jgi:hypothetical protein